MEYDIDVYTFAGFEWPKAAWTLPTGPLTNRRAAAPYIRAPREDLSGPVVFYLNDLGQPFRRWAWANAVKNSPIGYDGWYYGGLPGYDTRHRGISQPQQMPRGVEHGGGYGKRGVSRNL